MTGPKGSPGTDPLDIGQRLELFVDYFLIENMEDAKLKLHRPQGAGTALNLDRPWEGRSSGHFTVILDKGKYKLYYRGWPLQTRTVGRQGTGPVATRHLLRRKHEREDVGSSGSSAARGARNAGQ